MDTLPRQPGLFDTEPTPGLADAAAQARTRMREMIDRLRAAAEPPWTDEMGLILRDGEFKRAMYLVPADEAAALWAEFDVQMERLYAIWAAGAATT